MLFQVLRLPLIQKFSCLNTNYEFGIFHNSQSMERNFITLKSTIDFVFFIKIYTLRKLQNKRLIISLLNVYKYELKVINVEKNKEGLHILKLRAEIQLHHSSGGCFQHTLCLLSEKLSLCFVLVFFYNKRSTFLLQSNGSLAFLVLDQILTTCN